MVPMLLLLLLLVVGLRISEATYSSYSQAAPYGATHGSFSKDWASRRAYSAYSFLDAITEAD